MTVRHLRIDNRLIHGQVTVAWAGNLGADRLVVSNDEVAADEMQRMILPQAARGVATSVLGIQETLDYCASDAAQGESIFVIAKLPSDALALVQGGLKPEEINVGNQAPRPGTKFTMVTRSIAVTAEDAETYRAIAAEGFSLQQRMMPTDKKADFLQVLGKKKL
ncbi:MAG TPA: PTS sugar transporter subunit IIB [Nocardioides sp.]|jgi:PTS system mannose-specific IIB component|nr:PTS sugar transporter subunit IIB [Nocardioides sp.]